MSALRGQTWHTASFWHVTYLENAVAKNKRISWELQVSCNDGLSPVIMKLEATDEEAKIEYTPIDR